MNHCYMPKFHLSKLYSIINIFITKIYLVSFLISILSFQFTTSLNAQNQINYYNHINFGGNLMNFSEFRTIQDHQDYMWFTSKKALYNFYGYDKKLKFISDFGNVLFKESGYLKYDFYVNGLINKGFLTKKDIPQKVIIKPPISQTLWGYSIYILLICILIVFLILNIRNRNKLRNELNKEHLLLSKQKEIDNLRSIFFANISHEFRTPLTLILGPLEKWLQNLDKGDLKNDLKMIYKNSLRISRLITQLLDLSRLDSGEMKLNIRPENIVEFLRGLVLSFATLAKEKNINLSFISSNETVIVYMDRDKIENIISNLIINAFKYTPANGKISVSIVIGSAEYADEETPPHVEITVRDTGTGIAQDQINNIFDRFYQVEGTTGFSNEGTGIGLSVAKELTELHHGKISVKSGTNHGTIFTVLIPLGKNHFPENVINTENSRNKFITQNNVKISEYVEEIERNDSRTKQPEISLLKNVPLILIVEDNADARSFLRKSLSMHYRISEASNGVDGMAAAHEIDPDLIICDVMMPEMDGYELCQRAKSDPMICHIPVILVTAKADTEDKIEGLYSGADDYIFKPFNMTELLARIRNLIKQRKNLQKRFREEIVIQPGEITVTSVDKLFLQQAISTVEEYICESEFETQTLADELGMSRMNLHRKMKALTGQTPSQFICTIRLKRAVQLIKKHSGNVTEIAYEVGFSSSSYFTKCFRAEFGIAPSEYAKSQPYQG